MPNPEYVLENETQNFFCDFEIKTDNLILTRRPDLVIANKQTARLENKWTRGYRSNYCIIKIGMNIKKNPDHLMRRGYSNSNEKPSANADVKNSNNNNNINESGKRDKFQDLP